VQGKESYKHKKIALPLVTDFSFKPFCNKSPLQLHLSHTQITATMFRSSIIRNARLFSTNARFQKSAVDTIKEAAQAVDRTISDAAVKGIETGGTLLIISPSPFLPYRIPQSKPPHPSSPPQT
jgi:hypothetical protein